MEISYFLLKTIALCLFIAVIGTLFSLGLSPKDKALENQEYQIPKFIVLNEQEYHELMVNGINVNIDEQSYRFRLDELGISLVDNSTRFEDFLAKIFNKSKNYEITFHEQELNNTIILLNDKFKSKFNPKIEITEKSWVINPIINDKFVDYIEIKYKIFKAFEDKNFNISFKTKSKKPDIYIPSQVVLDSLKENLTKPIYIDIDDLGEIKKYQLNELEIYKLLVPTISNNSIDVSINQTLLNNIVEEKLKEVPSYKELRINRRKVMGRNTTLNIQEISTKAYEIIKSRINHSSQSDKITATTKYAPFTNGDKFEKYIEVDLSQKMLYAWENGILKYEMIISSGFNGTTPSGEFQIQNKADNPYSDIDNSYMPFWMSFHKDKRFDAWLGFHALTHKITSKGKYIYEPESNLGGTTSGGCVKLGRKQAEELYNWAEVGDKVLIHN